MAEHKIQNEIRNALAAVTSAKMFRVNVGNGWIGEAVKLQNGDVLLKNPRPFSSGLPNGTSDLIGWTEVVITADMIGQKIAVFTAGEVKTKTGRLSDVQKNFIAAVQRSGGAAYVWRDSETAVNDIKKLAEGEK